MIYLAIDYGKKHVGLALCDQSETFAHPLNALPGGKNARTIHRVLELAKQHEAEALVVGLPRSRSGEVSEMETAVREFVAAVESTLLSRRLCLSVELWDERFSTASVLRGLREVGISEKKARAADGAQSIDARAAAGILQDFLEAKKNRAQLAALDNRDFEDDI